MQGKATIARHPVHPILIPFPIVLFVLALVSDVVARFDTTAPLAKLGTLFVGAGLATGILAAIAGILDFRTAQLDHAARRAGRKHLIVAIALLVIFNVDLALRMRSPDNNAILPITIVGTVVLAIVGFIGGHLVFVHQVGVSERDEVRATRPLGASET